MSWESSIKAFKSYLKIERSLSDNSIVAYTRDIKKFADYAINLELSESKIERNAAKILPIPMYSPSI